MNNDGTYLSNDYSQSLIKTIHKYLRLKDFPNIHFNSDQLECKPNQTN